MRLLVLHNLTYLERLVSGAREAIGEGRFDAYREGGARRRDAVERPVSPPPLLRVVVDEVLEVLDLILELLLDLDPDVGVLAGVGDQQHGGGDDPGEQRDQDHDRAPA